MLSIKLVFLVEHTTRSLTVFLTPISRRVKKSRDTAVEAEAQEGILYEKHNKTAAIILGLLHKYMDNQEPERTCSSFTVLHFHRLCE